jgi:hypothetical protein
VANFTPRLVYLGGKNHRYPATGNLMGKDHSEGSVVDEYNEERLGFYSPQI